MLPIIFGDSESYLRAATERMEAQRMLTPLFSAEDRRQRAIREMHYQRYCYERQQRLNDTMVAHYLLIECKEGGE